MTKPNKSLSEHNRRQRVMEQPQAEEKEWWAIAFRLRECNENVKKILPSSLLRFARPSSPHDKALSAGRPRLVLILLVFAALRVTGTFAALFAVAASRSATVEFDAVA